MSHVAEMTPYEKFLQESLEENKKHLESLTIELQRSNLIRKMMLKSRLAEINQNILILSSDLEKYGHGLSWLREPTKERDEKAEHLGPVDVTAIVGQAKPATPPVASRPAPAVGASTTVGTPRPASVAVGKPAAPVGVPKPSVQVGQPRPSVPVGQAKPSTPVAQASTLQSQVSTPTPVEPKPAEAPKSLELATQGEQPKSLVLKQEKKTEESESAPAETSESSSS